MAVRGIDLGGAATVAFVGVAKHSGKTTALGRFVEESAREGNPVGLLSIGVDGESRDAILGVDKPSVPIVEGSWVVAGDVALARSTARFEYQQGLGISTPLGRAYLARATDGGEVVLGGLRHRSDLLEARDTLREAGGERGVRVFIDGAYGRRVAADGRVADGVVVSTGAVVAQTPDSIVEATERLVECLQIAECDGPIAEVAARAEAEDRALFATSGGPRPMPRKSALAGIPTSEDRWPQGTFGVAIPGALTDGVLEDLMQVDGDERSLAAMAPASIRASREVWRSFADSDWTLQVRYPVELLGIAANPVDPTGPGVERGRLRDALRQRWPSVPVFDARR